MHQSFVTTAPTYGGWSGDSGANMRDSDILSSPAVRVSAGLVILRKYTP